MRSLIYLLGAIFLAIGTGVVVESQGFGSPTKVITVTSASMAGGNSSSPSSSSSASVGYDGPAICSPTTDAATSGGSPAALEASGTEVAYGTLEGEAWSLWAANGDSGAAALEDGGLVFNGAEYGLCPGYPNPSETEMIDTGQDAVIYGVVNYPGRAKVQISTGEVNSFAVGTALPAPHVAVVDGVSFYIGTLPNSACSYTALEINTTSPSYSAEHNIAFAGAGTGQGYSITNNTGNDGPCVTGQLDPLSYSEGTWQLPPGQFNADSGGGGGSGAGNGPSSNSNCSPTTDAATSGGSPAALEASATQVASGTVSGQSWSLWSANGESGATGLEDGGLVLNGAEYGLCPGYPNPSETEMIDTGSSAIVYGVVGYPGLATVDLSEGTIGSFATGAALPSPEVQVVNGVSFYIGTLPDPACSYTAFEINTTSPSYSAEHNIGFAGSGAGQGYPLSDNTGNSGGCVANEIDPISYSEGIWQLPPGQFQQGFGGPGPNSPSVSNSTVGPGEGALPNRQDQCTTVATATDSGKPATPLTDGSSPVASGTVGGTPWSLYAASGESGVVAIEDGGFVYGGLWYGMCTGAPNPGEFEMIDAPPAGIVYGYIANPGDYSVTMASNGQPLPAATTEQVNGGTFFVIQLSTSACSYSSLDMTASTSEVTDQHHFDFGICTPNQLVAQTGGFGSW